LNISNLRRSLRPSLRIAAGPAALNNWPSQANTTPDGLVLQGGEEQPIPLTPDIAQADGARMQRMQKVAHITDSAATTNKWAYKV
jgi:hypothetical protein